jgi:hypothetical protein
VDLTLERGFLARHKQTSMFGDRFQQWHHPFPVTLGKVTQYVMMDSVFMAGMPNAKTHTLEIRPQMRN